MNFTFNINLNAAIGVIALITFIIIAGLFESIPANFRWLLILAIITIFLMGIGKQVGGRYDSILIDNRYKISLSRFQITLWTVLILSSFLTMALDRNIPALTQNAVANLEPLNIRFPEQLLIALGISTASLTGSSLIKRTKTETESGRKIQQLEDDISRASTNYTQAQEALNQARHALFTLSSDEGGMRETVTLRQQELAQMQTAVSTGSATQEQLELAQAKLEQAKASLEIKTKQFNDAQPELEKKQHLMELADQELKSIESARQNKKGVIHQNQNPSQAEWSDLFRGDEIINYQVIDIAKVQMFFFTIAIIFTYSVLIWSIFTDVEQLRVPILDFPPFSTSLNGLLGLSHAGYLAVKSTN